MLEYAVNERLKILLILETNFECIDFVPTKKALSDNCWERFSESSNLLLLQGDGFSMSTTFLAIQFHCDLAGAFHEKFILDLCLAGNASGKL